MKFCNSLVGYWKYQRSVNGVELGRYIIVSCTETGCLFFFSTATVRVDREAGIVKPTYSSRIERIIGNYSCNRGEVW